MLQRNSPQPTRRHRGRARVRRGLTSRFTGHRNCTIARQPMTPIVITCVEAMLDQEPAKTRTIDKKITFDDSTVLEHHGIDRTRFAVELHIHDLGIHSPNAKISRVLAQTGRIQSGIEMKGVTESTERYFRLNSRLSKSSKA